MTRATPPVSSLQTEQLPTDIRQLAAAIEGLPTKHRQSIEPLLERVVESSKRRRRILHLVQEAISQLRLDMKYLVFDLEATRRERDDYRHKLEGEQE
ncbi:MAG: transcriptional regulator [Pirellulales bacterium]